ncbi:MAG: hypothetical protein D6793_09580 [Thermoflexia bacterium]|nr:MAG: hypothetical protein D6793_09580 [Thermoflexia bacterium]
MRKHLWPVFLVALLVSCSRPGKGVLFSDRFGNPESGWGKESQESFDRGYQEGEYFIEVYEPNWLVWATPGKRFQDVAIEVDARRVSGAAGGNFGLLCRYRRPADFYYFAVTDDGYYAILRVEDGEPTVLTGSGFLPSPDIPVGAASYRIGAICAGDRLRLLVNGKEIAAVVDVTFRRGDVGLAVGTGHEGPLRVHFDNFRVTEPEEK